MGNPTMSELTPPDFERCQTEIKEPGGAFAFGIRKHERCKEPAVYLLKEEEPDKDGLQGEMTVCASCYLIFDQTEQADTVTVHPITEEMRK